MSDETQEAQASSLSVIEQQERANIDLLVTTAKKYPRDLVRVKRNMEAMATIDQETAEACNYRLVRDGHSIEGPGVRLAEIAVACYQNIRSGSRVISNDGKVITGQAFCHDLENNTFVAWETQRRITDKKGRTYTEDMQVVTGNAAAAIAFRNAVFKVIPGVLVHSVAEKAREVAVGDLKTLTERRTRALKRFAAIGVSEERILAFLGRKNAEEIDIADVEKLFGVFTAIRDESTTIEEQFPAIGKIVEPNFDGAKKQPAAQPPVPVSAAEAVSKLGEMKEAVATAEPPRPRRGRPPKNLEQPPLQFSQPEKPAEQREQIPNAAGSPGRSAPNDTGAGQTAAPASSEQPVAEPDEDFPLGLVKAWLTADHLDVTDFIRIMERNGFAKPGAKLEDVESEGLEVALKQREQITKHLRELASEKPFA